MRAALPGSAMAKVDPMPPITKAARASLPGVCSQRSARCRKNRKIAANTAEVPMAAALASA
jgi:hypothetical protein